MGFGYPLGVHCKLLGSFEFHLALSAFIVHSNNYKLYIYYYYLILLLFILFDLPLVLNCLNLRLKILLVRQVIVLDGFQIRVQLVD